MMIMITLILHCKEPQLHLNQLLKFIHLVPSHLCYVRLYMTILPLPRLCISICGV